MFSGIIESIGTVEKIEEDGSNIHFQISSDISTELTIDQSVAHNGVCLTVVRLEEGSHVVTAIDETLKKSNLGDWTVGDRINLERCIRMSDRLDGHIVQGHVDTVGTIQRRERGDGSDVFTISYADSKYNTVEKGSICVNGISLTVVDSEDSSFSIAIIPYTLEHTNLHQLEEGDHVNLEFDIVGKYLEKMIQKNLNQAN